MTSWSKKSYSLLSNKLHANNFSFVGQNASWLHFVLFCMCEKEFLSSFKFFSKPVGFLKERRTRASLWNSFATISSIPSSKIHSQQMFCMWNLFFRTSNSTQKYLVSWGHGAPERHFETALNQLFQCALPKFIHNKCSACEFCFLELQILSKTCWFLEGMAYCNVTLRLL